MWPCLSQAQISVNCTLAKMQIYRFAFQIQVRDVCYNLCINVKVSKCFLVTCTAHMIDIIANGPCLAEGWEWEMYSFGGYNSRLMAVKGLSNQCQVNKWPQMFSVSRARTWSWRECLFPAPSGKSPYLMFTNRHEIRRIDLLKSEYAQVVPTLKNAVALDVDVSTNKMFWCDLYHRKIYRYRHTHNVQNIWFVYPSI